MPADALHTAALRRRVNVARYAETLREEATVRLEELGTAIRRLVVDADLVSVPIRSLVPRQEELIRAVRREVNVAFTEIAETAAPQLASLAKLETAWAERQLEKNLAGDVAASVLKVADFAKLADASLVVGATPAEWVKKLSRDLNHRLSGQIRMGSLAREPTKALVGRLLGQPVGTRRLLAGRGGKVASLPVRGPGPLETAKNDTGQWLRDTAGAVSADAQAEVYDNNADSLDGVFWSSVLDPKTCLVCAALDGGAWDATGQPLPDSTVQRPGPPSIPAHPRCRCVLVPVPVGDGLPNRQSFADWLKARKKTTQDDILGPARAALWRSGKLKLQGLVDQSGRRLTLEELAARLEE